MIKLTSGFTRQLFGSVLLCSLLATGCSQAEQQGGPGAGAPPALPVKVVELKSEPVEESSEFVGTLEAAEKVTLQPQIQGRVEEVFVSSGDRVRKGTPIASLSEDQTQADVAVGQASVNEAQSRVSSAEADKASKQATLRAREAARDKLSANLQLAEAEFARTQALVSEGALSTQQLDIARRDLDFARADLTQAERDVGAARADVAKADADIAQAESGVARAQADVDSRSVNLGFKQVTSPIDGVVGDIPVRVGDVVTSQSTITTITRNNELDMRIAVPSNYSSRLRTGLPVQLIDPNTKQALGSGSLYFISPRIDTGSQSVLTKARFPNASGNLRDGQYVQSRIVWNQATGVLIPTTAITRIGGQSFVFVVEQKPNEAGETQQVVTQRPVKLGAIQGNNYVVLEGLKPGDQVATSNILKLRDGAPIQPEA